MKPNILIVDDEIHARELYSLFLSAKGYAVSAAGTPQDAMKMLQEKKFDLAVLDLSLKDYNGLNLLKPIKEIQPQLPIVVYTGREITQTLLTDAFNRGACALLSKTQSLQQLLDVIKKNVATTPA